MTTATELACALIERVGKLERKNADRIPSVDYGQLLHVVLAEVREACPALNYDRLLSPETRNALFG
jgi:hypothetical protein